VNADSAQYQLCATDNMLSVTAMYQCKLIDFMMNVYKNLCPSYSEIILSTTICKMFAGD
jgi:hypothetical protein